MPENIIQIDQNLLETRLDRLITEKMTQILNAMLDAEADEITGAARYERSGGRKAYRAGHYERKLTAKAGRLELKVPKLKGALFESAVIERYRRREQSVEESLIDMYLAGVSTRQVDDISQLLWGDRMPSQTLSDKLKRIYGEIDQWRTRPLESEYPYVFVDGVWHKRSWGGRVENVSVLVAIGINAEGQRSQYACNIDGLISVDPVFIQKMVEINGPVTLSNGTVLTGENTAEYMLNTIYKDVPVAQQDEYFEYIAKTVMDGAFGNMTVDKMMKVAQSIGDLAENRHFYAYTFHDDEAKYFQGAGLAKNAPESETNPETGIYISEQNPSKMGWYIDRTSEVTKTGDKTYHVKYTLTNRMTSTEMATCTSYILGGEQKGVGGVPVAPSGTSAQRVLIYAPAGGSIGSIAVTGDVRDRSNATMDGKPLNSSMAYIAPGKSVTYEFDVTVSDKATADMKLDQTPCGKMTNDVKYNY